MARQLLKNAGAGVTGIWVSVQMGRRRSFPIKVTAVGTFAGDIITIEHLFGGLPGSVSLYGNTNSPYGPVADTGTPVSVGTIANPGDGLFIEGPVEFIRAKTGGAMTGSVTFCGVETLE